MWLKNFVLDALARRDGAAAVQLLIDNDEIRAAALPVPAGTPQAPRIQTIDFDQPAPPCPWEERRVLSRQTFRTFAARVREALAGLIDEPLVGALWRDAEEIAASTGNLGFSLARLRHRLEHAWGVNTLELPLSHVCSAPAFSTFAAILLSHLPRLAESHNRALAEYRRLHKLRSGSHPVPDLAREGDWLEAPFWLWTSADPQRRRAFVRLGGDAWLLSDHDRIQIELSGAREADAAALAELLAELPRRGIKLRPRALVTTMYARLVLGDLFIHGIGGAKYDQITDGLIADLFGIPPPGFMTVSGTRLLPLPRPRATADDIARIDSELRDLRYRAEDYLEQHASAQQRAAAQGLIDQKRWWLAQSPPPGAGKPRQAALASLNAQLAPLVASRRQELLARRGELQSQADLARLWGSREFAFCLFPEGALRPWLLDAAAKAI